MTAEEETVARNQSIARSVSAWLRASDLRLLPGTVEWSDGSPHQAVVDDLAWTIGDAMDCGDFDRLATKNIKRKP